MAARVLIAVVVALTVGALAAGALAPAANADGDPASDVLIVRDVFFPWSSTVSGDLQKRLDAEVAAAHRAHFPIKVALIVTPRDLGAIVALFGKPQQYASFLSQEIGYLRITQPLLVVMPNGYGVQRGGGAAQAAVASLKLPMRASADDLARAALVAIPKVASAAGHPLATTSSASGTSGPPSILAALVLATTALGCAAAVFVVRQRLATR